MLQAKKYILYSVVGLGLTMYFPAGCFAAEVSEKEPEQSENYLKADPIQISRWRDMKFGLFIHWDPVSLVGTEVSWSRGGERRGRKGTGEIPVEVYDNLYKSFYPARFDAKGWVAIAKAAGMRYLVFTTKHHDGFSMFDTVLTDYKITNSPFRRDVVRELSDACHQEGLKLGFYYSQPDWHHPDYRTENHTRYVEYLHGQIRELCTNYGRVDCIFFDGLRGKAEDWDSKKLFRMIRRLQPDVVINDRAGLPGDYFTPEQRVGEFQCDRPWESCITIGTQWAWKTMDQLKPVKECIRMLVATVGGDGNLLLNVGPMPTGQIEPRQVEILKKTGEWLRQYGESVYGSRGGPFKSGPWGASTYKSNLIYAHIFNWTGNTFSLPSIPGKIIRASLLTGGKVQAEQSSEGIKITVAEQYRQAIDTIVVLELDGPAERIEPVSVPSGSLAFKCHAESSSVYNDRPSSSPDMAFDDSCSTCWRSSTNEGWLEVNLGTPQKVDTVVIYQGSEYFGAEKFELLCKLDGQWKQLAEGTKLGQPAVLKFETVRAQQFRLNASRGDRQIIICEFQLFGPEIN